MSRAIQCQWVKKRLICGEEGTWIPNAVLDRRLGGCDLVRLLASGVALSLGLIAAIPRYAAADEWGGSLDVTSDYVVRGISRSNDQAALQVDLHYLNTSGFVAGLFASNSRIDPAQPVDVELDGFLGFGWTAGPDWHGKILATHYAYPGAGHGFDYKYDELDLDWTYREWLNIGLTYSPDAPRFSYYRGGWFGVAAESAELSLQRPVLGKVSATAGAGYAFYGGPGSTGYAYGSVGVAYDLSPVSLVLSFVDTTAGAKTLFYDVPSGRQWTGTVIWRF
jgi:uncharacterized protein (TIGR02001 family)